MGLRFQSPSMAEAAVSDHLGCGMMLFVKRRWTSYVVHISVISVSCVYSRRLQEGLRFTGTNQIAYKSWWPTHAAWISLGCGLNTGYWNEHCEAWYQHRLFEIRTGKAQPLGSQEWKRQIRGYGDARRLRSSTERVSASFLSSSSRV